METAVLLSSIVFASVVCHGFYGATTLRLAVKSIA